MLSLLLFVLSGVLLASATGSATSPECPAIAFEIKADMGFQEVWFIPEIDANKKSDIKFVALHVVLDTPNDVVADETDTSSMMMQKIDQAFVQQVPSWTLIESLSFTYCVHLNGPLVCCDSPPVSFDQDPGGRQDKPRGEVEELTQTFFTATNPTLMPTPMPTATPTTAPPATSRMFSMYNTANPSTTSPVITTITTTTSVPTLGLDPTPAAVACSRFTDLCSCTCEGFGWHSARGATFCRKGSTTTFQELQRGGCLEDTSGPHTQRTFPWAQAEEEAPGPTTAGTATGDGGSETSRLNFYMRNVIGDGTSPSSTTRTSRFGSQTNPPSPSPSSSSSSSSIFSSPPSSFDPMPSLPSSFNFPSSFTMPSSFSLPDNPFISFPETNADSKSGKTNVDEGSDTTAGGLTGFPGFPSGLPTMLNFG